MIIKIKREVLYQLARMAQPAGMRHQWTAQVRQDIHHVAEIIAQATAEQHCKRPITIQVV